MLSHYTPVLPVLLLRGGRDITQDLIIKRGILGVLIFNITPVCEKRGILGVLIFNITPVRKTWDIGVNITPVQKTWDIGVNITPVRKTWDIGSTGITMV